MALTANRELNRYVDQELRSYGVAAEAVIHKGAFVGIERASGLVRLLQPGDLFAGIAYEEGDNTSGLLGGETSIRVYTEGDFILPTQHATQPDAGAALYAIDSESLTTQPDPGSSFAGIMLAAAGAGQCIVRIMPAHSSAHEHALNIPLGSSTTAAVLHTVLIPQRQVRIISAQAAFHGPPDQGTLDIGITPADPDEMVDGFSLSGLAAGQIANLPLVERSFVPGDPIFARVGQASSLAGTGGLLSLRYIELA